MTASRLPAVTVTRLEKAAADNGFDHELAREGDWLRFGSSHAPLEVWLTASDEGHPLAGLSRVDVARALEGHGELVTVTMPTGAQAVRRVMDVAGLHRLLRRAYQFARALPDELLHAFEKKTHLLPRSTEAERLLVQRVGQDLFRAGLLEYWAGRCAITGLAVPELLRASHIKPWADCDTDAERLDVYNGLLLAPHLDAVFDRGFIGVEDDGAVMVSPLLPLEARQTLGIAAPLRVTSLDERHRVYLPWHRAKVFKQ